MSSPATNAFTTGQPHPRLEDERVLRGQGEYLDDLNFPGQAHAVVLRSPVAHAELRAVRTESARVAPGVIAVLTGADVQADGLGTLPNIIRRRQRDGGEMVEPPYPILAIGRVRHVGEAVAMVVAETSKQALDAAELVELDCDELPVVGNALEALQESAPVLWPDVARNEAFVFSRGDKGAVDAAFKRAGHRVRLSLTIPRVNSCALEPRGAIGTYDPKSATWCLYASVQKPNLLRGLLARAVFRVPDDRLHVVAAPYVGGSFGTKGLLHPELALVLWAAQRLSRPVKWVATRGEGFLADYAGRDNVTTAELALDEEGRFLAIRVATVADMGAYLSSYGTHSPTNNLLGLIGVYGTPSIHVEVVGAYSNTAPTGPYRGAGRPEASYVIERLIDVAGSVTGIDPVELRRRNLIASAQMPYRTPLEFTYDSGDFQRNMERALDVAGFATFAARRSVALAGGRYRGLGIANCLEVAGPAGFEERAQVRIAPDGVIVLRLGTDSQGQGHATAFTQLACEMLRVPPTMIRIEAADTRLVAKAHGSFGSRSACVAGSALALALGSFIDRASAVAAALAGTPSSGAVLDDGGFRVAGREPLIRWGEIAGAVDDELRVQEEFVPTSATFPNGCHVAEVEVDPDTGHVAVVGYTVVDDVGRVLNPLLVEGQLHGGVAQGLGEALMEAVVHDEAGQVLTGSFTDYALPRARDLPFVTAEMLPVPTALNPLGAKGAGEAGIVGALPALVNAVCNALAPLGVTHVDMPLTPMRVWQAIERARPHRR